MPKYLISEVLGNSQSLDGGAMFGNVPRSVWQSWIPPDDQGRIHLECRSMLLEIAGQRILCETGIGAFFEPKLAERFGVSPVEHRLLSSLKRLGLTENDIDMVILSHLHFDHAGGLLPPWEESQGPAKRLLFPNAKYVVGTEAFARAESPHPRDRASFIPEMTHLLKTSNRLILIDGTSHQQVFPDHIKFFYSHGHTPGHMHTVATGNQYTVTFAGDLIPGVAWIHLPVTMGYDRFAERVIDEKAEFYSRVSNQMAQWVFYTHDHKTSMSRIAKDAKGRYTATDEITHPVQWEF